MEGDSPVNSPRSPWSGGEPADGSEALGAGSTWTDWEVMHLKKNGRPHVCELCAGHGTSDSSASLALLFSIGGVVVWYSQEPVQTPETFAMPTAATDMLERRHGADT